jgi:hypothetical protein
MVRELFSTKANQSIKFVLYFQATRKVDYFCKTDKRLVLQRVFLNEKVAGMEERDKQTEEKEAETEEKDIQT